MTSPLAAARFAVCLALALLAARPAAGAELPKPLVTGLKKPRSVAVGTDGRIFVTVAGEDGKDGTGAVLVVADGKATPFATGFDRPSGMVAFQGQLFVADAERVWRIDPTGKATVCADAS